MTSPMMVSLLGSWTILVSTALAGEPQIVADLETYFRTDDPGECEAIVRRIESDEAYDRSRVSDWLHRMKLHEPCPPGVSTITVPIDHGEMREVMLRVPPGYDPSRKWPMIYALHGSSGHSANITSYVLDLLGPRADEFVIAAPNDYRQTAMGEEGEPSVEHPAILLALKRRLHIDGDRVYATGYSKGGYTTWTLATLHADQFAGAIPIACTYSVLPYVDGLWETMIENVRHLPVLHCFGELDFVPTLNLAGQDLDATITQQNDRLMSLTNRLELTGITHVRQAGTGHGGVRPPDELLNDLLDRTRGQHPRSVHHRFRYIHQASAYWLEGHRWSGPQWTHKKLTYVPREGETMGQTLGREIHKRLGELKGEIDGQTVRISARHVAELTIWFGDGMIDFSEPVRVLREDVTVHQGMIVPDLHVALNQARRTYDFDRLRWAGLRIRGSGQARVVTGRTRFDEVLVER